MKPLYEKLRVISVEANLVKQENITQALVYTAKVEKFNNGEWTESTDLEETQKLQLNWHFIKNNDDLDTEILTDQLTDDDIEVDGLTMTVNVQDDNILQFGHAHCFVNSAEQEEGHALTELKRQLDVQEVLGDNVLSINTDKVNYRIELNIDNPTADEIKELTVEILEKDSEGKTVTKEASVKEDLSIEHSFKEGHTLVEVRAKVYPKEHPDNSAEGISYLRTVLEGEVANISIGTQEKPYSRTISTEEEFLIKVQAGLPEGEALGITVDVFAKEENKKKTMELEEFLQTIDSAI